MEKDFQKSKHGDNQAGKEITPTAREKYGVLSGKYGNDFYGYAGYVLLEKGPDGWLKLIENIPLETVDAAVSTWIQSNRPAKPDNPGSTRATTP